MRKPISPARSTAFQVLLLVEGGGYASDLLLSRSKELNSRDAGLAAEIVFGAIRRRAQLDFLIELFSGHSSRRLDIEVLVALRMGVYQIRYLDRVPTHAAVAESVELVKVARKHSAGRFVNAVLRKVHRDPIPWPEPAVELSQPHWLLERWQRQFGEDTARKIARAFLAPPETYVRVPPGREPVGMKLEPTEIPGCLRLMDGEPTGFRIHDIGSQSIVPLLELRPGQRFLDLCAAPGNKTAQALESKVRAVACDIHFDRLVQLKTLGCELVVLDGAKPLPFGRIFDRILVDAPCSGTGTLGRNPEIRWRLRPGDLRNLQERQVKLLLSALEVLSPSGLLVYSTCSLEPEENELVVEKVLGHLPGTIMRRIPGIQPGDGFFAAVLR